MKKIKALTVIFLALTLMLGSVQASAAGNSAIKFKDVKNDYWGKSSIDYVSANGYMVGYGKEFGILDKITEGQYLAVLCRIFGYKDQSPLTVEAPARELGLVKEGEKVHVDNNLRRDKIAKYTVRAYEKLNNAEYPDYLVAYKSLIKDYNDLDESLKLVALKAMEKGLLAGDSKGNFSPNETATRSQAAAFIHRLLEKSEQEKVKPIFAKPDKAFEDSINSGESLKYASIQYGNHFGRVVDGRILFNMPDGEALLPNSHNKTSNKEAYEILRALYNNAKLNGHHVRYHLSANYNTLFVRYYSEERLGLSNSHLLGGNLTGFISLSPTKYSDEQKEYSYYGWHIGKLVSEDNDDWAAVNYREEALTKPILDTFKVVYGEELGKKVYTYAISEFDKDRKQWFTDRTHYNNSKTSYVESLGGLEISNQNGTGESQSVYFYTNKK